MEGMMGMPSGGMQVEVDETEDTEWNDILRQHKIIPEKPKDPDEGRDEILAEARQLQHDSRLDDLELDELDELEDDEDDAIIMEYKARRMKEMQETASRKVFGSLIPITKGEYTREVTEASQKHWVFVFLYKDYLTASKKLRPVLEEFSARHASIKVCAIVSDQAMENYPDQAVPTILVYHDGDMKEQFVGLKPTTTLADLERLTMGLGALTDDDVRRARKRAGQLTTERAREEEVDDWSD
ncbi:Phosducin family protein [Protomyces lactucae-debilis]|uniref:Phosducin family protein n=1 Tax=Protomyces lactucae-debilis TaxID=2754530 RepID=A0A1Y2F8Y1_PROLT|nr:Phosducin family protein [Protomyces lactucae-debilis]ORY80372.1 Phosducin family protein [Protomyces lactucae-debilis]